MKYALVCPNEPVTVKSLDTPPVFTTGYRIAQVEAETFPVGDPTYWLECVDEVVAGLWYFDTVTQQPTKVPVATGLQSV